MVKDHSDSEKGNPLPPHRLLLSINSKGLYAPSHRQDNTYHGLCYTSRGALAGTRNSSMGPAHEGSIRWPTAPWANVLPLSYVPLRVFKRSRNSSMGPPWHHQRTLYGGAISRSTQGRLYANWTNCSQLGPALECNLLSACQVHTSTDLGASWLGTWANWNCSQLGPALECNLLGLSSTYKYRSWCKLTGNLGRLKLFPIGPRRSLFNYKETLKRKRTKPTFKQQQHHTHTRAQITSLVHASAGGPAFFHYPRQACATTACSECAR